MSEQSYIEKIIKILKERNFDKEDVLGVLLIASEDHNHIKIIEWLENHPDATAEELFMVIA